MSNAMTQSTESLSAELAALREKLRAFRFGGAGSRTRNVREGRALRKDIARILTELNARTIAEKRKTG